MEHDLFELLLRNEGDFDEAASGIQRQYDRFLRRDEHNDRRTENLALSVDRFIGQASPRRDWR